MKGRVKMELNLRAVMKEKNYTQERLAQDTGIAVPTISRYMGNKVTRYDKAVLEKLMNTLKCKLTDIIKVEQN